MKTDIKKFATLNTPFYYYDIDLLRQTLETVKKESGRYGYSVHYAVKANFDDRILSEIAHAGFGADCVSGNEVRKAIETGIPAGKVVFAGVGKTDAEINYALDRKIFCFNVESRQELEVINELAAARGVTATIALRINPDVDPQTHKYIATGHGDSKFGVSYTEIDQVIAKLPELKNVAIVGLHFHIGSQIRKLEVYEHLCSRVNEIQKWFEAKDIRLSHINVGGGLGVDYDNPEAEPVPDFKAYFSIFRKRLELRPGQTLHFELGRSIVAQCGWLATRVLFNKTTAAGREVAVVDAGMTDLIRPALYQAHHKIVNLTSQSSTVKPYTVAGPVCESSDVFARDIMLPATRRGDLLAILSAGAYGQAMASNYNLRDLPRAIYSDQL